MEDVGCESSRIRRGEQVWRQDEGAEDVVGGGGEERCAVWRPLSALEVIALVLGMGPRRTFGF